MPQLQEKTCKTCGLTKPVADFYLDKRGKGNYFTSCKECEKPKNRARMNARYRLHPEILKARRRERHKKHREKENAISKRYRFAHPEYFAAHRKKYYAENRDKLLSQAAEKRRQDLAAARRKDKEKYAANPDAARARAKRYARKNQAKVAARSKEYREKYPEKRAAWELRRHYRKRGNGGQHSDADWAALLEECGGRCLACGARSEPGRYRRLEKDHIIPITKGGRDDIWNLQPLCRPCNNTKKAKAIDYRPLAVRIKYAEPHVI
jgi:5-methylcytosine-specific restriction endonuclease McrA